MGTVKTTATAKLEPITRKEALIIFNRFAYRVQSACDATGQSRTFERMTESIRQDEKSHRRLGSRLLGGPPPRSITVGQTVDYFVTQCAINAIDFIEEISGKARGRKRWTALSAVRHAMSLRTDYQCAIEIFANYRGSNDADATAYTMDRFMCRDGVEGWGNVKTPAEAEAMIARARLALDAWDYTKLVKS